MRDLEAPDERLVAQIYIDSRGSVDTKQHDTIVVGIDDPDVGRACKHALGDDGKWAENGLTLVDTAAVQRVSMSIGC